jgi:hypothetical protein
MNSQITDFVHDALLRGVSREDINQVLLKGGWTPKEIKAAMEVFVECDLPIPVPRKRVSSSAKEAFLFLMLFSTLYTAVFALGAVLFDLININLPDPGEAVLRWIGSLRFGIASVVVSFPIFLLISRVIVRENLRNPGQRISPVRRWLTYLTLFVASASIVTDLITLIVSFLSGDLTLRFGLKVLVVAVLAGIVFFYYLRDLRRDEVAPSAEYRSTRSAKFAFAAMIMAVLLIIVFGFWASGSPMKARLYAQDDQRVGDLADICRRVELYYLNKGVLPDSLDSCDVSPDTFIAKKADRVTGEPYGYRVIDTTRFEVGATFVMPSLSDSPPAAVGALYGDMSGAPGFWRHDAGRKTFTVDATKKSLR